jgi:hypothetical protein
MSTTESPVFPRYHFNATSLETAQVSTEYPYGSLRCKMFFYVEDGGKKGWRCVQQTINPKNGRLNAPKKSTYRSVPIFILESKEGFFEFLSAPDQPNEDGKNVNDFIEKYWSIIPEKDKSYLKINWKMYILRSPNYYRDTVINVELPLTKSEKIEKGID